MVKFSDYLRLVKFSHTIFAMPFAMIGFTYALKCGNHNLSESWQWVVLLVQVVLCMVFARNTAMGFNRWADWRIDAENPRTANREIPAGVISPKKALWFVVVNAVLFITTASTINILTAVLSPVALAVVMFYSYCKRFTSLAHLVLGLSLGIAPVGAYIAVTGEFALAPCILAVLVMTWCGGFDIIYALQDAAFDRERGLHSIPSRFSARTALLFSTLLHVISAASLIWFASLLPGRWYLWIGITVFCFLLALQHLLVTPTKQKNIGIAFGTLNGLASLTLAIFVILDLLL
ncbi:MAG: UbiA family prenyltransferase [Alistipes sp.]|nr:UbiA family prenyltransferase [Alistipes sp.]